MAEQISNLKQKQVTSMPTSLLVSATYEREKNAAVLKFYEPKSQKIILWTDETNHKPYCYSKLSPEELDFLSDRDDVLKIETVKKHDTLNDCEISVSKIIVANPLVIGGTDNSIRNLIDTWESDIKYYENYLYDRSLIVGKYYKIEDGKIEPQELEISDQVKLALKSLLWDKATNDEMVDSKQFQEYLAQPTNPKNKKNQR